MIKVAIDGPAGAGKSSVSKEVAKRCNLLYIDTGAMYRAITLLYLEHPRLSFYRFSKTKIEFNKSKIILNGQDVSKEIRNQKVTDRVSYFAAKRSVRNLVDKIALRMSKTESCLMDGRDIGTKVMPMADLKIYLDASPKVRAKRRLEQQNLPESEYNKVLNSIIKRDKFDSSRKISPLRKADDAIHLLTDNMKEEEVIDFICEKIRRVK